MNYIALLPPEIIHEMCKYLTNDEYKNLCKGCDLTIDYYNTRCMYVEAVTDNRKYKSCDRMGTKYNRNEGYLVNSMIHICSEHCKEFQCFTCEKDLILIRGDNNNYKYTRLSDKNNSNSIKCIYGGEYYYRNDIFRTDKTSKTSFRFCSDVCKSVFENKFFCKLCKRYYQNSDQLIVGYCGNEVDQYGFTTISCYNANRYSNGEIDICLICDTLVNLGQLICSDKCMAEYVEKPRDYIRLLDKRGKRKDEEIWGD